MECSAFELAAQLIMVRTRLSWVVHYLRVSLCAVLASQALECIDCGEFASRLHPLEVDIGSRQTGEHADAEDGGLHVGVRSIRCKCKQRTYKVRIISLQKSNMSNVETR